MTEDKPKLTIHDFIAKHQIEMAMLKAFHNPSLMDNKWAKTARHWDCTITLVGFGHVEPMHVYFSQGIGHAKSPTAADVLDCLASDAASIEAVHDFEGWADEMGFDKDSRAAERTYHAILDQRRALMALLGRAAYWELLNDIERL